MFYTYILYSENHDQYYIGHCEHLEKRLERHNNKTVSSTKKYAPWCIVYYESFNTRIEASRRELGIKKMKSRVYILSLIEKNRSNA